VPDATHAENLPRLVPLGLLAAAGFLSVAGARVIDPLIAVIGDEFDASVPAVSRMLASFTLAYGVMQVILGPLADRLGKLRVLLGALLGYVLFTGACAFATNLSALTALRAGAGAASAGLIPCCMAYIGDTVSYDRRQVTLGHFMIGIVLAQTIAGPLGGVFGEFVGWRGVFLLLAAAALTVGALLLARLHRVEDRPVCLQSRGDSAHTLLKSASARLLLLATFAEGALMGGVFPFVGPFLHERFGLSFALAGLVLSGFGLGAFAYVRLAGRLLATMGEAGLVLWGGVLVATMLALGLPFAREMPGVGAVVAIEFGLGLGYFMVHGVMQARATELLPGARSTAVASFVFMLQAGQSVGALCMGEAIARLGYSRAFAADGIAAAVLTALLFGYVREVRAGEA
jgi:predicted MFS family arabinose efflux permease